MLVIAHRGASAYAPENTMAAFELAYDLGARAIELDVQMSSDGVLVVIHDFTLERTSNGKGMVHQTPWEVISNLDAGSWFDEDFAYAKIPTLDQVLAWLPANVDLNIEIKKLGLDERNIAEAVIQRVKESKKASQIAVSSFDHQCLLELQAAGLNIGVLTNSNMIKPVNYMKQVGLKPVSYNPSGVFVTKELVKEVHGADLKLYTYTVNDPDIAKHFEMIGVDGIFSNYPDLLSK